MGAGPWLVYNSARRHLMDGSIDLDNDTFSISLYQNGSNASDITMQVIGDLTSEVANANGYTGGGQTLGNVTWNTGDTPAEMRWDANDIIWQAVGGDIVNVQYAVIWRNKPSAPSYLLFVAALDENGPFTVPSGNPLSVAFNVQGIFELN